MSNQQSENPLVDQSSPIAFITSRVVFLIKLLSGSAIGIIVIGLIGLIGIIIFSILKRF